MPRLYISLDELRNDSPRVLALKRAVIAKIKTLARKHGRTPTFKELISEHGISQRRIDLLFGGFNGLLKMANLSPNKFTNLTKTEITQMIKSLGKRLGKSPSISDFKKAPDMPSIDLVTERFGTWNAALKAAGFIVTQSQRWSKERIAVRLRAISNQLGP